METKCESFFFWPENHQFVCLSHLLNVYHTSGVHSVYRQQFYMTTSFKSEIPMTYWNMLGATPDVQLRNLQSPKVNYTSAISKLLFLVVPLHLPLIVYCTYVSKPKHLTSTQKEQVSLPTIVRPVTNARMWSNN